MTCRKPLAERFWAKVDHHSQGECWPWTAAINKYGYGLIGTGGAESRHRTAHRVSYELAFGELPASACVLHRCDNPRCVNPAHLFLGTQMENIADRNAKCRQARGERVAGSKLTFEQVVEIRRSAGSHTAVARRYGVARTTIGDVRCFRTWNFEGGADA